MTDDSAHVAISEGVSNSLTPSSLDFLYRIRASLPPMTHQALFAPESDRGPAPSHAHRLAVTTAARPSCKSFTKWSGTSNDGKCPPVSGAFHRTICRYRSCAQGAGTSRCRRG